MKYSNSIDSHFRLKYYWYLWPLLRWTPSNIDRRSTSLNWSEHKFPYSYSLKKKSIFSVLRTSRFNIKLTFSSCMGTFLHRSSCSIVFSNANWSVIFARHNFICYQNRNQTVNGYSEQVEFGFKNETYAKQTGFFSIRDVSIGYVKVQAIMIKTAILFCIGNEHDYQWKKKPINQMWF